MEIKFEKKNSFVFHLGHRKIVELLIQKGADVDAVSYSNYTALMLSAADGNERINVQSKKTDFSNRYFRLNHLREWKI